MGSAGATGRDLVARVKVVLDQASAQYSLQDLQAGFRQLALSINRDLKAALDAALSEGKIDQYVTGVGKLGQAWNQASEQAKAASLVAEKVAEEQKRQQQAAVAFANAAKQAYDAMQAAAAAAIARQQQQFAALNQQTAQMLAATTPTQRGGLVIGAGGAMQAAPGSGGVALVAVPPGTPGAMNMGGGAFIAVPQNQFFRAPGQVWGGAVAPQPAFWGPGGGVFGGGAGGAGGGAAAPWGGGGLGGFMGGALAGAGGALIGGGGIGAVPGAALAGGLAGAFGVGSPVIAGMSAALNVVKGIADQYLEIYNRSQDWLATTRLVQKEIGLAAQEAATMRNFMAFTQNPDSPFATIIFSQVQASLKNVVDFQAGLIKSTPQIELFVNGLKRLGLEAQDSSGKVKDVISFAIEMSRALQALPTTERAQVSQQIGGLFGKDFMALVGTDASQLERVRDAAVSVSEEMLKGADARVAAIQSAVSAERQFEIAATNALTPIELQVQRLKEIVLIRLSAGLTTGFEREQMTARAESVEQGTPLPEWARPGTKDAAEARLKYIQGRLTEISKNQWMQTPLAMEEFYRLSVERGDVSKLLANWGQGGPDTQMSNERAVLDYKAALKDLGTELGDIKRLEEDRLTSSAKAVSEFDKSIDATVRAGNAYDTLYGRLRDVGRKIDELEKLRETPVTYYKTPSGETVKGTLKQIADLSGDIDAYYASEQDEAEQRAARAADLAESIAARAAPSKTGKPGKGPTAAQQRQQRIIARGGTWYDLAVDRQRWEALEARAAEMGFKPEEVPFTTEDLTKAYGKRGLTKNEVKDLAEAYEDLKELKLADKEAQFNTMREAIGKFNAELAKKDDQQAFRDGLDESVGVMQKFVTEAGLFSSAGFARAIGEASLAAKLSSGGFGEGAGAIEKYVAASGKFFTAMGGLSDYVSGRLTLTPEKAIEQGLMRKDWTMQGPASDEGELRFAQKVSQGKVTPSEVMLRVLQVQGIEAEKGIESIFNVSGKPWADKAEEDARAIKEKLDGVKGEIEENPWKINIVFGSNLGDIERAIEIVKGLKADAETQGFLAPQKPTGTMPIGEPPTWLFGGNGMPGAGGTPVVPAIPVPVVAVPRASTTGRRAATGRSRAGMPYAGGGSDLEDGVMDLVDAVQAKAQGSPIDIESRLEAASWGKLQPDVASKMKLVQEYLDKNPLKVPVTTGPVAGLPAQPQANSPQGETFTTPTGIPIRDIGGSVEMGRAYWVGGTGRELFVPSSDGQIVGALLSQRLSEAAGRRQTQPPPMVMYQTSSSSVVNIDARGARSPLETVRVVENAARALFVSDRQDPRGRMDAIRRGR